MIGPFHMYRYDYPELGWYIMLPEGVYKVCHIDHANFYFLSTFYMEPVIALEPVSPAGLSARDYRVSLQAHDMEHYGRVGRYHKSSYGNPAIGQNIYWNSSWMRVTFVGDYTFDMEHRTAPAEVSAEEEVQMRINTSQENNQGNEIF
jgi:hypothetical protein